MAPARHVAAAPAVVSTDARLGFGRALRFARAGLPATRLRFGNWLDGPGVYRVNCHPPGWKTMALRLEEEQVYVDVVSGAGGAGQLCRRHGG